MSIPSTSFQRAAVRELATRLAQPRRFIQVVAGPRQVGKTTAVQQALAQVARPSVYAAADGPAPRDAVWLAAQWERGRLAAAERGAILVLDEIQKIAGWSEVVKACWDEDSAKDARLWVVVLGSAPLLVQQGLSESLAGRFEMLRLSHWSFSETRTAFGFTLDQHVYFGGYPGAAALVGDAERWRRYVLDSLVETTIARDVLLMTRVDKPALLRRAFELGCRYSGQVLSYNKMLGQLQDAGNTITLAHYFNLLAGAGMVVALDKFAGQVVRSRASSPKLQVCDTALMSAVAAKSPEEARADTEHWGRLVESAVGAHLVASAARGECELFYWRDRGREVDFVLRRGDVVVAIEVKSGRPPTAFPGLTAFTEAFSPRRTLVVGEGGVPLEEFLLTPVPDWLRP